VLKDHNLHLLVDYIYLPIAQKIT